MAHAANALIEEASSSEVPAVLLANVLPSELLKQVQADAGSIAECPNYWFSREDMEVGRCRTVAEEAIVHLAHTCLQGRLPADWAGAEWWVQRYEGGRGLAFHFDKDEHAMKERGKMITPIFSSVLYLTGSPTPQRQSPTVIVNQRFDQKEACAYPDHPDHSTLVFPAANSYCLFDGGLGHGVLDCGHSEARVTFLVNWWKAQPQAVQRVTEGDVARFKLTRAFGGTENAAPNIIGGIDSQRSSNMAGSCGGDRCSAGTFGPATPPRAAARPGKEGSSMATPVLIPSLSVSDKEVGPEGCLTLDDLLLDRGLSIVGKGAVPGVALSHPGLLLFPVDGEQLRASRGRVQIGAALVPLLLLSDSCRSGGEEEGEEEGAPAAADEGNVRGAAAQGARCRQLAGV